MVAEGYGENVARVVTYLMAFDKETEALVGEWPLDVGEDELRRIFRLSADTDWLGDHVVAEDQREALQRLTSHRIDLGVSDYFVGDRDVDYGRSK